MEHFGEAQDDHFGLHEKQMKQSSLSSTTAEIRNVEGRIA